MTVGSTEKQEGRLLFPWSASGAQERPIPLVGRDMGVLMVLPWAVPPLMVMAVPLGFPVSRLLDQVLVSEQVGVEWVCWCVSSFWLPRVRVER